MPVFTQDFPDYDVLLVADESEVFGTYLPYRTWIPRPVAGTAGLVPSAWHPASERSEEHTSDLQSLMRISYAVFCLKKKYKTKTLTYRDTYQSDTYIKS